MNDINTLYSLEQAASNYLSKGQINNSQQLNNESSFKDIFNSALASKKSKSINYDLTFSKHASMRLENRNISLSDEQMERLNQGILKARDKNINESLVMMDDLAFIVSVNNKTIITALDKESSKDNVFTNIDGAVII